MTLEFAAMERLLSTVEEVRLAAQATDARTAKARAALQDANVAFSALCERLGDPEMRELARALVGSSLERAAVVLDLA